MTIADKKSKALELSISQIDRQFGKGSIMRLGDDHPTLMDNVISTGALSLDVALGIGGVPRGRIIEIFGPESSGKTTLALHIVVLPEAINFLLKLIHLQKTVYSMDWTILAGPYNLRKKLKITNNRPGAGNPGCFSLNDLSKFRKSCQLYVY